MPYVYALGFEPETFALIPSLAVAATALAAAATALAAAATAPAAAATALAAAATALAATATALAAAATALAAAATVLAAAAPPLSAVLRAPRALQPCMPRALFCLVRPVRPAALCTRICSPMRSPYPAPLPPFSSLSLLHLQHQPPPPHLPSPSSVAQGVPLQGVFLHKVLHYRKLGVTDSNTYDYVFIFRGAAVAWTS
ncbi:unnamed protein product [Closterium sp. NIES-54]